LRNEERSQPSFGPHRIPVIPRARIADFGRHSSFPVAFRRHPLIRNKPGYDGTLVNTLEIIPMLTCASGTSYILVSGNGPDRTPRRRQPLTPRLRREYHPMTNRYLHTTVALSCWIVSSRWTIHHTGLLPFPPFDYGRPLGLGFRMGHGPHPSQRRTSPLHLSRLTTDPRNTSLTPSLQTEIPRDQLPIDRRRSVRRPPLVVGLPSADDQERKTVWNQGAGYYAVV
jgi:hypothetical protein